jgi:hypothetical protein
MSSLDTSYSKNEGHPIRDHGNKVQSVERVPEKGAMSKPYPAFLKGIIGQLLLQLVQPARECA